ncbi:energy transducer TonB [Neolewinella antarctica]|uniref:TonB C-terminal domain-containing protein n=1 Tax=Neolewinella antarctica TaxID=442734 RepID=A0ABX0XEI0_9BACT|nr:energy transducer TonB [Neolewinella antarctica]NJC27198.1 hypothetical protein [Neolewinella antarctica]
MQSLSFSPHPIFRLATVAFLSICCLACAVRPSILSNAQFKGLYNDDFQPGETEVSTTYQTAISKLGDRYVRRTYFPSTRQIISYGEYTDRRMTTPVGTYKTWYDDGPLRSESQYVAGKRVGISTDYHRNGRVKEVGEYAAGEKSGLWKSYSNEGVLRQTYEYKSDELDGTSTYYEDDGSVTKTIEYRAGEKITDSSTPVSANDDVALRLPEKMPLFPGCESISDYDERKVCADRNMLEFIYKNIRYPSHARQFGVQGIGVVKFVVEKDGSLGDVEVIRGLDTDVSAELLRVVSLMPDWEAGEQGGEKVRVLFNLPVKFKLE